MAINGDVFRSILAMDSYNRGYDAGINLSGSSLGDAVLAKDSTQEFGLPNTQAASFSAQSYSWNGKTVISYRGTNSPGMLQNVLNGWPTGLGGADTPQAMLALKFYNAVDAATNTNIELTGHSLGGGLADYVGSGQILRCAFAKRPSDWSPAL